MDNGPRGCGIYVRQIQRNIHGTPGQFARKALDNGLRFVALQACWQTDTVTRRTNASKLADYGAALRERSIEPWVWGYPNAGMEDAFVDRMREGADDAGAAGMILDPELPYKRKPARLRELLEKTIDSMGEAHNLGFTSYGLISAHRTFPWDVAQNHGFGSPQVYSVPPRTAQIAVEQWRKRWDHIVASVPAFGPQSGEKLDRYLDALYPHVEGFMFWSWRSVNLTEWRTIRKWANKPWESRTSSVSNAAVS